MCDVHDWFFIMLIPMNLKLLLLPSSTDVDRGICVHLLFSKINDQLLGFVDVEQEG